MVFSSLEFISIFLPAVLILYWMMPDIRLQNAILLITSLIFYMYGEPVYIVLMVGSVLLNYLWARLLDGMRGRRAKLVLAVAVVQNLGMLGVFKYAGFAVELWNTGTGMQLHVPEIALPIGISFFTFQALSYVIDVYRGEAMAQKNVFRVMLYISFFPQLIAGPIVKYHDIDQELAHRSRSLEETAWGVRRFIVGLAKKVLIANHMAVIADKLFTAAPGELNAFGAWLGAAAYLFQIYFDFSGYSDMAIGLGQMFGFHFRENFAYPYAASSMREFWRRWHISLSGWFREYLYIPLGGNRKGTLRTCVNKVVVFACTGIWHGANLTFLFWGLYHGFFQILEEYVPIFRKQGKKGRNPAGHLYVLLVTLIGFVFFRAETMGQGFSWVRVMFTGFSLEKEPMRLWMSLLTPLNLTVFASAVLASIPWRGRWRPKAEILRSAQATFPWMITPVLLLLCLMCLAGGSYNPFIYFRF